ncbi:uncharacterized protein (TIGR00661 family) [Orenia metallireducens]|jgi:uncharacterized protein (TIGR00661 family)|uniref:UDP:flavonoid glycosyltransferase YjiC, YdhE family n=1 Tax=Orenia metallireducens TaxID=1413210 RepID=A0A285HGM2_9FIRM|nr:MJ1255/VC2487 family glycosyltransferase [Orenia metallireducens]PRX27485.1 uncharacterized protein (TIGR00661 family) [Orenia metallireducens]SNY34733.1 conserved hypothetical protein [Orenia metallireducens]
MRIAYYIQGEGSGHVFRSLPVIRHLQQNHQVRLIANNKAYRVLSNLGYQVEQINGSSLAYNNNKMNYIKTLVNFLESSPEILKMVFSKELKALAKFNPALIISDFEPTGFYLGNFLRIPVIAIDNINLITQCKNFEYPIKYLLHFLMAKLITKTWSPSANYYYVPSFIELKTKKNVELIEPIIREEILELRPSNEGHILVYLSSKTPYLLDLLKKYSEKKFYIFGYDREYTEQNLYFRKYGDGFIELFEGASAVIANGGFSFISEAIYLKKPVYSIPIAKHFEQLLNALNLEKMGYGKWSREANEQDLSKFINNLNHYRKNLGEFKARDNSTFWQSLDNKLLELEEKKERFSYFPQLYKR